MTTTRGFHQHIRRFAAEETGGVGILSVIWFTMLLGISGVAVDTANAYRYKAILQATADAAVLAAVMDLPDTAAATATALEYVQANMPSELNGAVLDEQDVVTGIWNAETRTIEAVEPGGNPADTIQVTVHRSKANGNPVFTSLLHIVGLQSWDDLAASATAMRFYPGCLSREGLISAKRVYIDTQQNFLKNFCIHGATGVTVKNDNYFEDGVKVTMEDLADFVMPTYGFDSNPGLEEALGVDFYDLVILDLLDELVVELRDPASIYQPGYIDPTLPAETQERSFDDIKANGLAPNQVHYLPCNSNDNAYLDLPGNRIYSDVVIVTDCAIRISSAAQFHNVTMATSFVDANIAAVTASAYVQWGADDACAPANGARVLALGELLVNAHAKYFGAQFISTSYVRINAQPDGGSGVSVISGEDIVLTSDGNMGLCPNPFIDSDSYRLTYYRLVG